MKIAKYIALASLAIALGMTSCVKDDPYVREASPVISEVKRTPALPSPVDDVEISAAITCESDRTISSAILMWTLDGVVQSPISMTKSESNYKATIPKQALNAEVAYTIKAVDCSGSEASQSDNYTVSGSAAIDYSKLVLNEVDPVSKKVELFNMGSVAIPLEGVMVHKNDVLWWSSDATTTLAAGAYIMVTGGEISAKKSVKFELKTPTNVRLGDFTRGTEPWDAAISDSGTSSYQRCPNGTGTWKMATPTNGATNPADGADIPQS